MALTSLASSIFIFFCIVSSVTLSASSDDQQTFIVHVSKSQKPHVFSTHHAWYSSIIRTLSPPSRRPAELLYTYGRVVHGFSARLTPLQAAELRNVTGVISVLPDQVRQLHTTYTPQFLGLSQSAGIWPNSDFADDVILGVLDTGIWPERPSFSDEGLSPVPSRWKGECETGTDFPASSCNRKIIGARAFHKGYLAARGSPMDLSAESNSPRDTEGHGTHTASTAAGSVVANASIFGYAQGEARGIAIKARIAAYKICWAPGCYDSDGLAGMDQAVEDGVDILSFSVGPSAKEYYEDSFAIGAFGATAHGVLVSSSAGNTGPGRSTASNLAPWYLTVGASTVDREFQADVILGDGRTFRGSSLYSGEPLGDSKLPLVYGGDVGSRYCYSGALYSRKVAGKIVLCERGGNAKVAKSVAVKEAGGVGMILTNTASFGDELLADAFLIPSANVGYKSGDAILKYIRSDPSPTATIAFRGTTYGTSPSAPRVAAFSSRGPNLITPEILKPDLIAPGVNILAGWTGAIAPSKQDIDERRTEFNIQSGTSMSCPHVSGLAALLRKAYPKWSPAAIKSALMTTAYNVDRTGSTFIDLSTGEVSNPFSFGSGHVDPNKALDPGLVYDLDTNDYVDFLCTLGYSSREIALFTRDSTRVDCSTRDLGTPGNLNYPSFSVIFYSKTGSVKYKRTVKNVGSEKNAVYEVKVDAPSGVQVTVSPTKLVFSEKNETLSYEVTFTSVGSGVLDESFGSITWEDGLHIVRSPIAVVWSTYFAASM